MADVVEMAVLQLFRCITEENPLTITFQVSLPCHAGGFHNLPGSSFKTVCERKTVMLYKALLH